MMHRLPFAILSLFAPVYLGAGTLGVTFPDGTVLAIETASTGSDVKASYSGAVASEGTLWHRVVSDKQGKVVFAYDLEASCVSDSPETFRIRIKPIDATYAQKIRSGDWRANSSPQDGPVPTVASLREFPAVKRGEKVVIDILYNPATGDKIYDLIDPHRATLSGMVSFQADYGEFSFREMRVAINGDPWGESWTSWIAGAAALIYIPKHGTAFLALQNRWPSKYSFKRNGRVDHNKLTFPMGDDTIEIASRSNILTKADSGTVFVYYDPNYRPEQSAAQSKELAKKLAVASARYGPNHPEIRKLEAEIEMARMAEIKQVVLQTADNVEWLLPRE